MEGLTSPVAEPENKTGGEDRRNLSITGKKRGRRILVWGIVLAFLTISAAIAGSYRLTVGRYSLHVPGLRAVVRLLLIADLHSCRYGEKQAKLSRAIEAEKPDALMLVGDIADDQIPIDGVEELLQAVTADDKYPCFYVTGNHEFWSGRVEEIKQVFLNFGVAVLEGECVPLSVRGETLIVCGVDDPESGKFERQLKAVADETKSGGYSILLSHRPERFRQYVQGRFDLVLAGHAHGGLWRFPGLPGGLVAPNQGFFPKYTSGEYREQSTTMIVSRGLARESTRIPRFFNPVEIVVIDLLPEKGS